MIYSECAHNVEVENLQNDEIISHSLLLIKGHVRQLRSSTTVPINSNPRCIGQHIKLQVKPQYVKRDNCLETGRNWELHVKSQISRNGQFKLLCDLGQHVSLTGANKISLQLEFSFCTTVHSLEVYYESYDGDENNHHLQPLYIVCCNQTPTAEDLHENCEKINLNLRLVQCVYAEELRSAGFNRRTFSFNSSCQIFKTHQTCEEVWQKNENSLWEDFAQELLNSPIWGQKTKLKFIAFIGCTKYDAKAVAATEDFSYANIRRHLKGHAALGGGGLALFGTAYLYAWPSCYKQIVDCFNSTKKVDPADLPDDSNYRRTFGGVYATTLGAVVHEIGHTFDLGHTKDGVMGNGFDYINRIFTVDNLTECLPNRIIEQKPTPVTNVTDAAARPRFTQLRRTSNQFLEKYHEQRTSEPFYFTRNCLIVLSHHKWFGTGNSNGGEEETDEALINYDAIDCSVTSTGDRHPLCLIEVRYINNSLVKFWYEFQSSKSHSAIYKFHLPKEAIEAIQDNHYLFVLAQTGIVKRLCEGLN